MKDIFIKIFNSKTFLQVITALIIIVAFLSFIYQISLLKSQGNIAGFPKGSLPPATSANINMIQPWMSIHYIEKAYHIPQEYLEQTLNIPPSRYNHLSINMYAKMAGLTPEEAIIKIQTAIHDYLQAGASIHK